MQNNNYYKLIGVINSYNTCSDFVRPVFKRKEKYYFQKGKTGIISTFNEIPKEKYYRITKLEDINVNTNIEINNLYTIGDNPVICFRIDKNNYFISDIDNFVPFIKKYETEDDILKEEIDNFLDCVKIKNNMKKKLLHK